MAQLKSTIVSGDLSVTDSLNVTDIICSNSARFSKIYAKDSANSINLSLGKEFDILTSNNEGEVYWQTLTPEIIFSEGTKDEPPKIGISIGGKIGASQKLTIASNLVYGVTKLTNTYDPTNITLATTGAALSAAINSLLNEDILSDAKKTLTSFKIQNGKILATFNDISIKPNQINETIPVEKGGTGLNYFQAPNSILYTKNNNEISTLDSQNGVLFSKGQNEKLEWGILPITQGGTGAQSAEEAKENLNLGSINLNFSISDFSNEKDYNWGIGGTVQGINKKYANQKIYLITTDNGLALKTNNGNQNDKNIWDFNINDNSIIASIITNFNDSRYLTRKILYKTNDESSVGDSSTPIYIDQNGQAMSCNGTIRLNASSSNKLIENNEDINRGDINQPIYFKNGVPIATNYSLSANVNSGTDYYIPEYSNSGETLSKGNILIITPDNLSLNNSDYYTVEDFFEGLIKNISSKNNFEKETTNLIGYFNNFGESFPGSFIGNISKNKFDEMPKYSTFIFHSPTGDLEVFGTYIKSNHSETYHKTYLNNENYKNWTVSHTGENAQGEDWNISILGHASSATKADKDSEDNLISSTYLKLSGGTMSSGAKIIVKSERNDLNSNLDGHSEPPVSYALTGGIEVQNQDNNSNDTLTNANFAYAPGISFNWRGKYAKKLSLIQNKLYLDNEKVLAGIAQIEEGGTGATTNSQARINLQVPSITGENASGDWNINITGSAKSLKPISSSTAITSLINYYNRNQNQIPKEELINFYYRDSSNNQYGLEYLGYFYNENTDNPYGYGSFLALKYNSLNFLEINQGQVSTHEVITNNQQQTFTGIKNIGKGGYLNGLSTLTSINTILIGEDAWIGSCQNKGIIGIKAEPTVSTDSNGNSTNITTTTVGFYFYNSDGIRSNPVGKLYYQVETNGSYSLYSDKSLKIANKRISTFSEGLYSNNAALNIQYQNNQSFSTSYYYPWINQIAGSRAFGIGVLKDSLYILNSPNQTSDANNNYKYQWYFKDDGYLYGNFKGILHGSYGSADENLLYFENSNQINFGGTNNSNTIYFGYSAKDRRPKPTTYIFGSGNGTATVKANTFIGSLTGNCTGSAGSVAWDNIEGKPSHYDDNAIINIIRSGTKFTFTRLDGSTGEFTQQDNNTTYSAGTGLKLSGTTFNINGAEARNTMGLGNSTGALAIDYGGTGATNATNARNNLGVPSKTGDGASGTWVIDISGSSNYATSASSANYATSAGSANYLTTYVSNGSNNISCLQNAFSGIPKSVGTAIRLQHGSHSMAFGWFLDGYSYSNAYGGWFISDYSDPTWVGVFNGSWSSCSFLTTNNYTSYCPTKTGSGASGTWGINISGSAGSANYATSAGSATSANLANYANSAGSVSELTYGFRNYDLNGCNIDGTNGNWTVAISESGHGTYPTDPWFQVTQFYSTHFIFQIAVTLTSTNTNTFGCDAYFRSKYAGNIFSVWRQVSLLGGIVPN